MASKSDGEFTINTDNPLDLCSTARFKQNTPADLNKLNDLYRQSMYKFTMIFANSEITVYKICNYLADNFSLDKYHVKTIDGLVFESYFDINAKHNYNMIKMEYLLNDGPLKDISGKWLIIPNMSSPWTSKLVHYVYSELKNKGCLGLIFHSNGMDNFGKILVQETNMHIDEYPNKLYRTVRTLPDDGF